MYRKTIHLIRWFDYVARWGVMNGLKRFENWHIFDAITFLQA